MYFEKFLVFQTMKEARTFCQWHSREENRKYKWNAIEIEPDVALI